jgi:DnaJ like chaperone protein
VASNLTQNAQVFGFLTAHGAAMQWVGKAIGGILGLAAGGLPGSVIGVVLGHRVDQGLFRERPRATSEPQATSRLFFEVAFEIMGRVAKIDGRVSEEEIRIARRIMSDMRLTPEQVQEAIEHFTRGKRADYAFDERLAALAAHIAGRDELALAFMQVQMQAAIGAGAVAGDKRRELVRIGQALGVGRLAFAQIEALVRAYERRGGPARPIAPNIDDAYRALGLERAASDEQVKTAYRRLMNQHHPDKLVARGLPPSMAGVAEQKTREIRAAYEKIKAARGLK